MKPIADYLQKQPAGKSTDDMLEGLMEDASINAFVLKNDLGHNAVAQGINHLIDYKEQKDLCDQCRGLYECKLDLVGMTPNLSLYNNDIVVDYKRCRFNPLDERLNRIDAMYVPKKLFRADLSDFDLIGPSRKEIHKFIIDYLNKISANVPTPGLYLSGVFGAGKTFILACFANELAKKGYNVVFAYYPDLVRELKSSIGSGNLEKKIERLKQCGALFLDDLGGESPSAFIRDEVLGPILQHRVLDELPTFFSSNLKMKTLVQSMAVDGSETERAKAVRIVERIRELAVEIEMTEKPAR